ncbi:hypothetical protein KIPB_002061 [Kipferlia bialata]|uniref:Uncharacterized protein n=1 Tax=Kipferlia bialata TaxID=797122 RepID=A0A9K3GFL8_9EUKA|nr:hypothetical protein KIPB_002061 [Kipferlia bialata]|eukprot:g2061.t1
MFIFRGYVCRVNAVGAWDSYQHLMVDTGCQSLKKRSPFRVFLTGAYPSGTSDGRGAWGGVPSVSYRDVPLYGHGGGPRDGSLSPARSSLPSLSPQGSPRQPSIIPSRTPEAASGPDIDAEVGDTEGAEISGLAGPIDPSAIDPSAIDPRPMESSPLDPDYLAQSVVLDEAPGTPVLYATPVREREREGTPASPPDRAGTAPQTYTPPSPVLGMGVIGRGVHHGGGSPEISPLGSYADMPVPLSVPRDPPGYGRPDIGVGREVASPEPLGLSDTCLSPEESRQRDLSSIIQRLKVSPIKLRNMPG